jgi:hypothetical protein
LSDSKRPGGGSRDISELKQRLGLKKGQQAAPQPAARGNGAGSGGVAPPPGMNLPPPPGVAQPQQYQQQQPMMPSAADDPFGAMNAMAAVAQVQRAPEIVIVNDGRPVENVGKSSLGALLVKILLPALLMLGAGIGIGRVSKDANFYNKGLEDAKAILGAPTSKSSVRGAKKLLSDLDSTLDEWKTKNNYRPEDAYTKKLEALAKDLEVKSEVVFRAKQNALDENLAGQILSFYSGVAEVKGMLDQHIKSAKADEKALVTGKQKADDATVKEETNAYAAGQMKYAILMSAPTEEDRDDFGAKIVEIGPVFCGDKQSASGKCDGESPSGFGYRNESGAGWVKGAVASPSESIPPKKLIKGSEPGASEVFYVKRVKAIAERAKKLITDANTLERVLQTASSKGQRFSFFL